MLGIAVAPAAVGLFVGLEVGIFVGFADEGILLGCLVTSATHVLLSLCKE